MDEETYARLTAGEIAAAVRAGEVSAAGVAAAALRRIERLDGRLRAFRAVWPDEARARAREVDRRIAAGEAPALAGVPLGVKGARGAGTTAARRLAAAGCVVVGATSVPGPGTAWKTWGQGRGGPTRNPRRLDRTPGGSSAGSAVAVAAGMVPMATGGDGAGSVRIPAAWCGVTGLKATNGALPALDRAGLAAPGVLVRCAADAAAYLRCVGLDAGTGRRAAGVRAAWSADLGFAAPDAEVVAAARDAVEAWQRAGVLRVVRLSAPLRLTDPATAWTALRALSVPGGGAESVQGSGPEANADEADATDGTGARTYGPARDRASGRGVNDARLAAVFAEADLLVTPTTPHPPHGPCGPGERYSTALTWAFNLGGHPAISVPARRWADGCPVGVQLVAAHGAEGLLVDVARSVVDG